ncbi:anti-phage deoxyguanosine triphosphatase [Acinetobacter pittii]|uniref:anti-phage deoxyguanosine triphosphatase n=1 Tax=Acinetobacter pittii TaxID=48296 RepID=UPI000A342A6D|nr:anti-phage deoxyguanosine triphosphatase [Acinetobacter pittii]OTS53359.1 dGTPase [Acinetobacter pittii]
MSNKVWEERRDKQDIQRNNDVRNEWERDYARLIHSSAFRRLQSKTQVLGLGESDFYRTRLTHSMEVAQIGAGIVRWLKESRHKDDQEIVDALPKLSLMNAICLAHDIGHPPFGHGGEVALNICMREHGGFEGNGQTLRILSRLDKYTDGYGMNPTRRLALGVLKYPVNYSNVCGEKAYDTLSSPKWLSKASRQHPPKCYLDEEKEIVQDWILAPLTDLERASFLECKEDPKTGHLKTQHHGLDTSIMELADDISYSLHDFEDAISLGMITKAIWEAHTANSEEIFKECGINLSELTQKLFALESYERKKAIGNLVHKLITHTYVRSSDIENATTPLIKWNAYLEDKFEKMRKHIFDLVKKKVIKSTNVQQLEFKGQKLVIELFEALASDPLRLLPSTTVAKYKQVETETEKQRVICDYISGMTDEYATRLYEKIYYPHKGSIFDRL